MEDPRPRSTAAGAAPGAKPRVAAESVTIRLHAGASVRCNDRQRQAIEELAAAGELRGEAVDVYYEPGTRPAVLAEGSAGGRFLVFDDGSARRC